MSDGTPLRQLSWRLSPWPWRAPFWIVVTIAGIMFAANRAVVQRLTATIQLRQEQQQNRQLQQRVDQFEQEYREIVQQAQQQAQIRASQDVLAQQIQQQVSQQKLADLANGLAAQMKEIERRRLASEQQLQEGLSAAAREIKEGRKDSKALQDRVNALQDELAKLRQSSLQTAGPSKGP